MPSGSGVRNYSNVFPATTVVGTIPASTPGASEVYTVNSVSGLPVAPFTGAFNRGQADEEAVLVTAVNAGTKALTLTRGYDGTAANAHSNATQAVAFEHVVVALDWREANAHINNSSVSGAHGQIVAADIATGAVGQAAVASGYVDLATDQSITGTKTFATDVQVIDSGTSRTVPRGLIGEVHLTANTTYSVSNTGGTVNVTGTVAYDNGDSVAGTLQYTCNVLAGRKYLILTYAAVFGTSGVDTAIGLTVSGVAGVLTGVGTRINLPNTGAHPGWQANIFYASASGAVTFTVTQNVITGTGTANVQAGSMLTIEDVG